MEDKRTFGDLANPKATDQRIKRGAALIASNVATVAIIAAAGIIVATTWLDIDLADLLTFRYATDALLTVILYCIVQLTYTDKGVVSGKTDPEYKEARSVYITIRDTISGMGVPYIEDFCYEFVNSRLKRRRTAFLAKHCKGLSYDVWEERYDGMNKDEIISFVKEHKKDPGYRLDKKHIPFVLIVNKMTAQNLTPDMLLLEEPDNWTNDAMSPSPLTVLKRKKTKTIIGSVCAAFFVVSILLTLGADPTLAGFAYMFLKLFFLGQRAFKGFSDGCLTYSVSAVTYHTDQRIRIEEYLYHWLPMKRARVEQESREQKELKEVKTA